jgi:hypothetical protein
MEEKVTAQKNANRAPTVDKDKVRVLVNKLRAGQAAGADVDVFSLALGPNAGCLSSKQILRAMVMGITDSEREHVLGCLPCIEHLRRMAEIDLKPDTGFVRSMLAKFESNNRFGPEAAEMVAACILPRRISAAQRDLHAIFATLTRVQKFNPVLPLSQVFHVDLVPLFNLEPFQFDKNSFELKGAFRTSTIDHIEKVDVNKDGKIDFLRIAFSNLKLSRQIAAAISSKRTIYDTVRLVGQIKDAHKNKFGIVAQANLEFSGNVEPTK